MLNWTPDFLKKGGERVERTKKMKEYRIRWGRRDEKKWGGVVILEKAQKRWRSKEFTPQNRFLEGFCPHQSKLTCSRRTTLSYIAPAYSGL